MEKKPETTMIREELDIIREDLKRIEKEINKLWSVKKDG